ncbi:peptidoglycan-binding domain-containing protein [Amycolatopsis vastitatis]|uniref:Peptidoglycan binding-like domain-containing protein n=1 Tax=Amycolatopsis vastitatis TaxID=1905142 RepID=A0A229TB32_9PSEU|nr:peptidoglycan-binding domain-containing protein [Amycolatopsis vastitatis]OXM68465.1 hypothetical protein CF165_13215 [Amycolatopsis vastitatis]
MPFDQPDLQIGDSGPAVARLQEDLTVVGCFADAVDGSFGQTTMDAVMQLQANVGLSVDGVVSADTWAVMEGPEATVEDSIDLADFPAISLAANHGAEGDLEAYLADLGITSVGDKSVQEHLPEE